MPEKEKKFREHNRIAWKTSVKDSINARILIMLHNTSFYLKSILYFTPSLVISNKINYKTFYTNLIRHNKYSNNRKTFVK